jgi:hypothetical protein
VPQSCPYTNLVKHYVIKTYGGVDVWIHVFSTSTLVGGEWSASCPGRFTPRERAPGTHWIGVVGPRAGLDCMEKLKFLFIPGLELRPQGRPARSQSLLSKSSIAAELRFTRLHGVTVQRTEFFIATAVSIWHPEIFPCLFVYSRAVHQRLYQ